MKRVFLRRFSQAANPDYLPSRQFMLRHVLRPSQKERFVQVASEIEVFKNIYKTDKPVTFDDGLWKILMNMLDWEERYKYLIEIQNSDNNTVPETENTKISEQNELRWKNGEMVYARNFHALLDIYGPTFRRQIDVMYGLNMINREKVPNFIVDCRFLREYSVETQAKYIRLMQVLHDENWFSKRPFRISFANYLPDNQIAALTKKMLLFQYGPASQNTIDRNFKRHPFAPNLSSRRISQIVPSENLMYISSKATRFVPETLPPNIKGVVFVFSNESSPPTSSTTACIIDKVQPYRMPIKKYSSTMTHLSLPLMGRVFRDYFDGFTMKDSILNNTTNAPITRKIEKRKSDARNEEFRLAMHHINNCSQSNHT